MDGDIPVPFPSANQVNLNPPSAEESRQNAAGILSATRLESGNTDFQQLLIEATFKAMTGHDVDCSDLPIIDAVQAAENLRLRDKGFRTRMVHMMVLSALVLRPTPPDVAARVADFSRELGVDDRLLDTVATFAQSDRALAAVGFERNGYTADWSDERSASLHTSDRATGWDSAAERRRVGPTLG